MSAADRAKQIRACEEILKSAPSREAFRVAAERLIELTGGKDA